MRILIAEDQQELSEAVTALLIHHGYAVDAVFDGQEALAYLQSAEYDCAVLDIMMPKMDGITVVKTIRQTDKRLPILLLTAKSQIDDRVDGLDAGADDYITKPFAMKELLACIRSALRRREVPVQQHTEIGNLRLTPALSEMATGTGSVHLTGKEYQLMEMLTSACPRLLSTNQIMESVWGLSSDADLNVVWVFLSNLRKKLQQIGANVEIKATRGVGYSLEVKSQ